MHGITSLARSDASSTKRAPPPRPAMPPGKRLMTCSAATAILMLGGGLPGPVGAVILLLCASCVEGWAPHAPACGPAAGRAVAAARCARARPVASAENFSRRRRAGTHAGLRWLCMSGGGEDGMGGLIRAPAFVERDFVAVQLMGAQRGSRETEAQMFLGPTLSFEEDGRLSIKSNLDFVDGAASQAGVRRAVPIPLSDEERELVGSLRSFGDLSRVQVRGRQLSGLETGQSVLRTRPLHEALPFGEAGDISARRDALARVSRSATHPTWGGEGAEFFSALDVASRVWSEAGCELLRCLASKPKSDT